MARLSADAIYQGPETYKEFKGALAENFALTELLNAGGDMPFYWKSRNMAEVDFVTQWNNRIVPIEVKSGTNRTARSLAEYRKRFSPEISVKVSLGNLETGIVMNIPLYLIWKIGDYIGK